MTGFFVLLWRDCRYSSGGITLLDLIARTPRSENRGGASVRIDNQAFPARVGGNRCCRIWHLGCRAIPDGACVARRAEPAEHHRKGSGRRPEEPGSAGRPTRATTRASGHSPLKQITPQNVNQLAAQWTFQNNVSLPGQKFETTPLVVDGVIYATGALNYAWAIDARTGRQLWRYQHQLLRRRTSKCAAAS